MILALPRAVQLIRFATYLQRPQGLIEGSKGEKEKKSDPECTTM